jgi:hypothetical protein
MRHRLAVCACARNRLTVLSVSPRGRIRKAIRHVEAVGGLRVRAKPPYSSNAGVINVRRGK